MEIIYSKISEDTAERLEELMPAKLSNERIVLNLGNSKIDESAYKHYQIINKVGAIKKCVDKPRTLRILKKGGIRVIKSFDLRRYNPLLFLYLIFRYLIWGKELVIKDRWNLEVVNLKKFFNLLDKIEKYLTISVKENKFQEYRVLVYKGKIFRILEKEPNPNVFAWKNEVCHFEEIPYYWHWRKFVKEIKKECSKASLILKIDLCGIDVIRTKKDIKILEVNSGAGMNYGSVRKFYQVLGKELEDGWVNLG